MGHLTEEDIFVSQQRLETTERVYIDIVTKM